MDITGFRYLDFDLYESDDGEVHGVLMFDVGDAGDGGGSLFFRRSDVPLLLSVLMELANPLAVIDAGLPGDMGKWSRDIAGRWGAGALLSSSKVKAKAKAGVGVGMTKPASSEKAGGKRSAGGQKRPRKGRLAGRPIAARGTIVPWVRRVLHSVGAGGVCGRGVTLREVVDEVRRNPPSAWLEQGGGPREWSAAEVRQRFSAAAYAAEKRGVVVIDRDERPVRYRAL